MRMFGKFVGALAMCSLPGAALAQAGCLSNEEARTLTLAMLPTLIETIQDRCRTLLPPDAAFNERGLDLVARYQPAADNARSEAGGIAMRIVSSNGEDDDAAELGEEVVLGFFEVAAAGALAGSMGDSSCRLANDIFVELEPLPAENFAGLIVLLMEIGMRDEGPGEGAPFRLCGTTPG